MVRVISEKLFSPPRSRHSSGETVDKELAARAVEVLSGLNCRRLELSDYESSSDSHWDSEVDVEGDVGENGTSKDQACGEGKSGGADILRKRKERRRERNKVSAQAYRVRRKEQSVKQQTVLKTLQDQNSLLKVTVNDLEDQIKKVRHSLRQHYPATLPMASSSTATLSPDTSPNTAPASPAMNSTPSDKPATFCQLAEVATPHQMTTPHPHPHQPMDNDQSHRQQISPVVDNFLFSKPPATATTPPSAINMTTVTPPFSFPPSPMMGGRHTFSSPNFLTSPLPTISEKPDVHFGQHQHRFHPQSQMHQHADINANANNAHTSNANTINANANVFGGMFQNNNRMNNNSNLFRAVPGMGEAGACADLHPQQPTFKVCKV